LAVQKALQIHQVSTTLAKCRKLVSHFHKSHVDNEFKRSQLMFSDIPKNKLIHDAGYDMIEQVCEQQQQLHISRERNHHYILQ